MTVPLCHSLLATRAWAVSHRLPVNRFRPIAKSVGLVKTLIWSLTDVTPRTLLSAPVK